MIITNSKNFYYPNDKIPNIQKDDLQLIYLGSCPFCICWAFRLSQWFKFTGIIVPYKESKHKLLLDMSLEEFKEGFVLWDPKTGIHQSGEAVAKLFSCFNSLKWILQFYKKYKIVKWVIDKSYFLISNHRGSLTNISLCSKYKNKATY